MRLRSSLAALAIVLALLTVSCVPGQGGFGGGGGAGGTSAQSTGSAAGTGTSTSAPVQMPQGQSTSGGQSPFMQAAKTVSQVVVNVGIQATIPGSGGSAPVGNGSGIIIRSDGYILTNDHVVSDSSGGLTAIIASETIPAKVVGRDPSTDLAVIKVDRTGLPAAKIGTPGDLQVGEWVVAVGYPFGLGKTVTHGIVSALGRSALAPQTSMPNSPSASGSVAAYTELIQTDAAINPGNSGGALAALDGTVVGVNTLIESTSGTSAGIGFAIPIDFAMKVADQLINSGKAVHPFLGIGIVSVSPHVQQQLSLDTSQGVLVQEVRPNSAAANAGLKKDDVIIEMAGQPITAVEDLYAVLRQQRIGSTIPVVVMRGTNKVTLQVTVGSDKTK